MVYHASPLLDPPDAPPPWRKILYGGEAGQEKLGLFAIGKFFGPPYQHSEDSFHGKILETFRKERYHIFPIFPYLSAQSELYCSFCSRFMQNEASYQDLEPFLWL